MSFPSHISISSIHKHEEQQKEHLTITHIATGINCKYNANTELNDKNTQKLLDVMIIVYLRVNLSFMVPAY